MTSFEDPRSRLHGSEGIEESRAACDEIAGKLARPMVPDGRIHLGDVGPVRGPLPPVLRHEAEVQACGARALGLQALDSPRARSPPPSQPAFARTIEFEVMRRMDNARTLAPLVRYFQASENVRGIHATDAPLDSPNTLLAERRCERANAAVPEAVGP